MLHQFFTGLKRMFCSSSPDYVTAQKAYGNSAEIDFKAEIKNKIPECYVKSNVMLNTASGKGEIDCLLLYDGKLFIVEIKNWKGTLKECDGGFVSTKEDRYTDELHIKDLKSPFKQVKRQIYLLKEMTNSNPWINPIVFFSAADSVTITSDNVYFAEINELANYIIRDGHKSYSNEINKCFGSCKETSKCLYLFKTIFIFSLYSCSK